MVGKGTPAPLLLTLDHEGSGRPFRLDREVTIIGRSPACDFVLGQDAKVVSSRHARIIRRGDGYCLEDLGSLNGTRVEGKRVTGPVLLRDGDRIEICDHKLLFDMPKVAIIEGSPYHDPGCPGHLDAGLAWCRRPGLSSFDHVLEISRNLGDALGLGEVLDRTLETLFAIFPPADRGFPAPESRSVHALVPPTAIRTRGTTTRGNLTICRTVLEKVMNEGQAILSTDTVRDDSRFAPSISLVRSEDPDHDVRPAPRPGAAADRHPPDRRPRRSRPVPPGGPRPAGRGRHPGRPGRGERLVAREHDRADQDEAGVQDAAMVQKAFLPQSRPQLAGYEFWDCYEPAGFVGGDYFDYLPLHPADDADGEPPRRLLVALGDVVGKGMPAALMMARLSAAVRLVAFAGLDPVWIMEHLNREHYDAGVAERFATCLLVQIDSPAQRLTIVTAGHMGRPSGSSAGIEIVGPERAGMPLGVDEEMNCRPVSATISRPATWSSSTPTAITDAMNPKAKPFGDKRLRQVILYRPESPSQVARRSSAPAAEHIAGRPRPMTSRSSASARRFLHECRPGTPSVGGLGDGPERSLSALGRASVRSANSGL